MNFTACLFFYLVIVFYPFSAIQAQNVPSYVPTNGLVGWWPFNGNANDESGNGNHGVVNGAFLANDRYGNSNSAYYFNSGANLICTTNQFFDPTALSYSAWIRTQSSGIIITFEDGQCLHNFSWDRTLIATASGITFKTWINSEVFNTAAGNVLNNQWHHVVVTYDNNGSNIYIDGVLYSTDTLQNISSSYLGWYRFGGLSPNNINNSMVGYYDDIGIWNRALNLAEVQQLYSAQPIFLNANNNSSLTSDFPSGISYQAVARDSSGLPFANTSLIVRFTLRDSSLNGPAAYIETHTLNTGSLGLFTTTIGTGTSLSGNFSSIQWMGPPKFLSVEIDVGNGFQLIGNQQLVSVPYANAADRAARIKNANLPVHNDNGSAISGGLEPGDMYRTPGGVLMIVY